MVEVRYKTVRLVPYTKKAAVFQGLPSAFANTMRTIKPATLSPNPNPWVAELAISSIKD
jgi:hypothetical protein